MEHQGCNALAITKILQDLRACDIKCLKDINLIPDAFDDIQIIHQPIMYKVPTTKGSSFGVFIHDVLSGIATQHKLEKEQSELLHVNDGNTIMIGNNVNSNSYRRLSLTSCQSTYGLDVPSTCEDIFQYISYICDQTYYESMMHVMKSLNITICEVTSVKKGIIGTLDLLGDDCIIEIKVRKQNVSYKDMLQAILYAALLGSPNIVRVGVYDFYKGVIHWVNITGQDCERLLQVVLDLHNSRTHK